MGDVKRLSELASKIATAVPRSNPEPTCWLNSDATFSYCYDHARDARARELNMVVTPAWKEFYRRNEYDDWFEEGIDGGYHGQMPNDNVQRCETCGKLLSYTLTNEGILDEITYWLESPVVSMDGDTAYEFERLTFGGNWEGADPEIVRDLITIAEAVVAILPAGEAANA